MFCVYTDHPIAVDSRDTTHPAGTMNDNSGNRRFNEVVYNQLFPGKKPLRVLDLGCSGGKFVRDCLDDGHLAVGLEGSDYSLTRKRAEWATIPGNLFTCDITKSFSVYEGEYDYDDRNEEYFNGDGPVLFDLVTAWEVMEHIAEEDLSELFNNVRKHLAPGGCWVMSVSEQEGFHHVCVHDKAWWLGVLGRHGFVNQPDLLAKFTLDDWVRGPHQNAAGSFHLIVKKAA